MVDGEEYKYGSSRLAPRLKRLLLSRWTHMCGFSIALSGMLLWSTPKPQSWLGLQTGSSSSASLFSLTTSREEAEVSCPYYDNLPTPFPISFWYVKSPKTASSTLSGVFRSVAAHHGMIVLKPPGADSIVDPSQVKAALKVGLKMVQHVGLANHIVFSKAVVDLFKPQPVLLFTSVREPLSQFHSRYVQRCLQSGKVKDPEQCLEANIEGRLELAHSLVESPQYDYVRDRSAPSEESVEATLANYDFVFVRDRLEESLVAFAIEYSLNFEDIAHLPAKVRTGKYPTASEMPAEVNDLVRSKTEKDLKLWEHANELLDQRIAHITRKCGLGGAAYFKAMVERFRRAQAIVAEECGSDYHKWYDTHGFTTELSYWLDHGEGPRCRDHAVRVWQKLG